MREILTSCPCAKKLLSSCKQVCILPADDEAFSAVQNFNVLVSEAPVDAEVVMLGGAAAGPHVVAIETEDVVFFVGWRQNVFPAITQSHVGDF